jgi:hypothetical protein
MQVLSIHIMKCIYVYCGMSAESLNREEGNIAVAR